MSIRTVQFALTANSISPTLAQSGGVQGEHNATSVEFLIDPSLLLKIQHEAKNSIPFYRIDAFTLDGKKISTEPKELVSDLITFELSNQLTQSGADIKIHLVISILSDNETLVDLYSYPATLTVLSLPSSQKVQTEEYSGITELYKKSEHNANIAKESANLALINAERTENAKASLESGTEFIFCGGDAESTLNIDLVVDDKVNEFSQNPIANNSVFKFLNEQIQKAKQEALLLAHPVGSYYFSDDATNPAFIFGGEWEQIKDRFILAAGDGYDQIGATGGASTHNHTLNNGYALISAIGGEPDGIYQKRIEVAEYEAVKYPLTAEFGLDGPHNLAFAVALGGHTDSTNNMPPYIVTYCYKRIK